jgi:hypothetical protein
LGGEVGRGSRVNHHAPRHARRLFGIAQGLPVQGLHCDGKKYVLCLSSSCCSSCCWLSCCALCSGAPRHAALAAAATLTVAISVLCLPCSYVLSRDECLLKPTGEPRGPAPTYKYVSISPSSAPLPSPPVVRKRRPTGGSGAGLESGYLMLWLIRDCIQSYKKGGSQAPTAWQSAKAGPSSSAAALPAGRTARP